DDFKTFTFNKSLECLTVPPAGAPHAGVLIAVTERSLDAQGNHRSYLLKGAKVARFFVKRSDGFDVSDCTILPPADLLLLERSYTRLRNIRMRIRRIPLALIKPDTLVDGKVLITADFAYQIDNMEGIAVHRNADGETIITLVSDDNFSFIQRNLLMQFALVGQEARQNNIRRSALADTRTRNWRPSASEINVTLRRFGMNRRLVLILEWLTLCPDSGPLPVRSQ